MDGGDKGSGSRVLPFKRVLEKWWEKDLLEFLRVVRMVELELLLRTYQDLKPSPPPREEGE